MHTPCVRDTYTDNKEHTVVKVSEECHTSSRKKESLFPDDRGVCQLTIMAAANNERVRVRVRENYLTSSNPHYILQGLSIFRPIIYGNTATVLTTKEREDLASPDHTHRWTVAVRSAASLPDSDEVGGADDLSYFIKRVTFKLHETYPNPSRSACRILLK